MKICVIGTGYVGLVGAAVFSDWGHEVVGVDNNANKIKGIEDGNMPIFEPGLKDLVLKNINEGRLRFTTNIEEGVDFAEIIFICVGTPMGDDGRADLTYVYQVAQDIAKYMNEPKIISIKSTVPVGTNRNIKEFIQSLTDVSFDSVSVPEFLREGSSIEDMNNTDRTVIGSDNVEALEKVASLFNHLGSPIVKCDLESAELIKYASNSFLATKISFINEIAQICELTGANVVKVGQGMGLDSRIGSKFLNASIGYGGSCFPKDVSALYRFSADYGYTFQILDRVIQANKNQKFHFINKIKSVYGENLDGLVVGVWGLAFKNNTDDIRESVAIEIVKILRGMGAELVVYDPEAMENSKKVLGNKSITFSSTQEEVLSVVDFLVVLTEWKEFQKTSYQEFLNLRDRTVFDGRNLFDPTLMEKTGIKYYSIGR